MSDLTAHCFISHSMCDLQVTGSDMASTSSSCNETKAERNNLLGWCADKAFSNLDGQVSEVYEEQLNLFYVLVQ